jgi:hypothetical protein
MTYYALVHVVNPGSEKESVRFLSYSANNLAFEKPLGELGFAKVSQTGWQKGNEKYYVIPMPAPKQEQNTWFKTLCA